jgi:lon-related putative ATP-dependent protease
MLAPLPSTALRRTIDPLGLGIDTTDQLAPQESIIGQDRAVRALEFGLGIQATGFNIYVAGERGIGKMTAVRSFLESLAVKRPTPPDWCYVENFKDTYQPKALELPSGQARKFQQDVKAFIEAIRRDIPRTFESEEFIARQTEITKRLDQLRASIIERLRSVAFAAGLNLQFTPYGVMSIPQIEGRPMTPQEFEAMKPEDRMKWQTRNDSIQGDIQAALKQIRDLDRQTQEQWQRLNAQTADYVVSGLYDDLCEMYSNQPSVIAYLQSVREDVLSNIDLFRTPQPPAEGQQPVPTWVREQAFRKYEVNVFVSNGDHSGAPVVVELNANYPNLFGKIEKETQMGALYTDFTMIKAGALHRANGGYLVLLVENVLRGMASWESLKRALRSREISIEDVGEQYGFIATKSLKPQPLPLDIKVVLVGRKLYYHLLHAYDEDFPELFKVLADFDLSMADNEKNVQRFLEFMCTLCNKEHMRHLDSAAAAKLLEYAIRLADDQNKLTTHFGIIADTLREANFWAQKDDAPKIMAKHIAHALEQRVYRVNLVQQHLREMIERGVLMIATSGKVVGQVNGLSVMSFGEFGFGSVSRITASVTPGRRGIVDIEREVALGGPIHSKGVLILSGYLAHRYGGEKPIALDARLVFEQSYAGVEGDSASSTELYALLSALSGVPIKQSIAVTGSVNQHGRVQAIGGANEKIEGFFDICSVKGFTGDQAVIIPASNVQHLMLREDIVEAVKDGRFNIWAVNTIDEGISLLTGIEAGERDEKGKFPAGSINALVEARLSTLAQALSLNDDSEPRKRLVRHRR